MHGAEIDIVQKTLKEVVRLYHAKDSERSRQIVLYKGYGVRG